jgi:hypothetical protein
MKNWALGFVVGIVMIALASLTVAAAFITVFVQTGGFEIPLYHIHLLLLITWFIQVVAFIPFGSISHTVSWNSFMARSIFVWMPIGLGWYLAHHVALLTFWMGLIISSTCVGYNMVVHAQKKA